MCDELKKFCIKNNIPIDQEMFSSIKTTATVNKENLFVNAKQSSIKNFFKPNQVQSTSVISTSLISIVPLRSLGRLEWRLSPSFQPHDRFLIPHNICSFENILALQNIKTILQPTFSIQLDINLNACLHSYVSISIQKF
ncbi:hypothetical protein BpHYR1_033777 [Brachionus plicatilis]|uniref:Uncharacterized protein n=1 Tax=Brachionus plicatilis TaxID=10195 RepID=A0A3M7S223_BRAPC|nr:hypothetical protein BpHYR1_033777 [Brachionus plicatilis]